MKYRTANNPLFKYYENCKRYAKARKSPISIYFSNWRGFAEWCESQGYDENVKLHYSSFDPFAPGYVHPKSSDEYPFEYIAYDARDPYELIITSAPSLRELSEKLHKMGYPYDVADICTSLSRNVSRKPIEERGWGLVFEKIDLTNYNEDGEPFEERNCLND